MKCSVILALLTIATLLSGCSEGDSGTAVPNKSIESEFNATYSDYLPEIPTLMVACEGSVTSKRTVTACESLAGVKQAVYLCKDLEAEVVTKSPAGTGRSVAVSSGVLNYDCAEGSDLEVPALVCDGGAYLNGLSCEPVGVGNYSTANNTRAACPLNSSTSGATAGVTLSDCKASPGYYLSSVGVVEEVGLGYKSSGDGETRDMCASGTYSDIATGVSCLSCSTPLNSAAVDFDISQLGLTSDSCLISALTCDAGFDSAESACHEITYSASWTLPLNDMNSCEGSEVVDQVMGHCTKHWSNLSSTVGNENCVGETAPTATLLSPGGNKVNALTHGTQTLSCEEGDTVPTVTAYACSPGYYEVAGDCVEVGTGFYSNPDLITRTACPLNSTTASTTAGAVASCLANAGYYKPSSSTIAEVGLGYKSSGDGVVRTACPAGEFSDSTTASSCQVCTNKPSNSASVGYLSSESALSSNSCSYASVSCDSGYQSHLLSCHAITYVGTYIDPVSTLIACDGTVSTSKVLAACDKTYSDQIEIVANSDCAALVAPTVDVESPAGSIVAAVTNGSETMTCSQGQSAPDSVTYICLDGHYATGGACAEVGTGYYSHADKSQRVQCPVYSSTVGTKSSSVDDCLGDAGHYKTFIGTFDPVGDGAYSAALSNTKTFCGAGTYSDLQTATSCKTCTNRGTGMASVTYNTTDSGLSLNTCGFDTVTCSAGYEKDPNALVCGAVTYTAGFGSATNPGLAVCGGTSIVARPMSSCNKNFLGDNTSVALGFCSGQTASTTFQSAAGNRNTAITNGTMVESCALGASSGSFSRSCNTGYADDGSSCVDACSLGNRSPGDRCADGTVFAGYFNAFKYKVMPGGCTNITGSGAASCTGGNDTLTALTLAQAQTSCADMTFGGSSDWHIPTSVWGGVMRTNRTAIGGLVGANYWTASPAYEGLNMSNGALTPGASMGGAAVRCMRMF